MKIINYLISGILSVLILSGCASVNIKQEDVSALEKGLSRHVVQTILKDGKPTGETALIRGEDEYMGLRYNLVTGSSYQPSVYCDQYGCYPIGSYVDTTSHFMAIFKNGKLYAWGTLDELAKHDDQAVLDIVRRMRAIPES